MKLFVIIHNSVLALLLVRDCLGLKSVNSTHGSSSYRDYQHYNNPFEPINWTLTCDRHDCGIVASYANTTGSTYTLLKPKKVIPSPNRHIGLCILIVLSGDVNVNPGPVSQPACVVCDKRIIYRNNSRSIKCSDCERAVHIKCSELSPSEQRLYFNAKHDWFCSSCASPCGSCPELVKNKDPGVQCDDCDKWYHIACGNVTRETYATYCDNDQSFDWICPMCNIDSDDQCDQPPRKADNTNKTTKRGRRVNRQTRLKVLVINFQSIQNKVAQLDALIHEHKPDIIQGTETWLSSNVSTSEIFPPGYNIFRKDRGPVNGGGVILAVKNDLICTEITIDSEKEIIWNKMELSGRQSLILGTFYKPHHHDIDSVHALQSSIDEISKKYPLSDIFIAGDFNQPNIDWTNSTVKLNHPYCKKTAGKLLEVITESNLEQLVHEPTRKDSILDIILTNNTSIVSRVSTEGGVSDHSIVVAELNLRTQRKRIPKRKVYIRSKADIEGMKKDIKDFAQGYFENSSIQTPQQKWDKIEQTLNDTMERRIPSRLTTSRYNLPWFQRNHRRMSRRKQRAYKKAKRTGNPNDWDNYTSIQKKFKSELKNARRKFVSDQLAEDLKNNTKSFWSHINKLRKDDAGVADLKFGDKIISNNKDKAEALSKQFSSVFTHEDVSSVPKLDNSSIPDIERLVVNQEGVLKQLNNLQPSKAPGPDQIPPWAIKAVADELAPILTDLFQCSLDSGELPSQWKEANVTGIFKKGDKSKPENYRPVSLTSITCKVLEHIVHSHVMKHLEQFNVLSDNQHGFRAKRSTETQLIQTVDDLTKCIDLGETIHMAILDFSKAFDKVPHQRLLVKLQQYGIRGNLLQWFSNFLIGRTQQVVCNGESSEPVPVISGVPQGTVLGPLLFLIYINDLPDELKSTSRLFADDCVVYSSGKDSAHLRLLQRDLTNLQTWQDTWQMEFNASKCYIMKISNKQDPPSAKFTFCGQVLEEVKSHPYLGVELDHRLKWDVHRNKVIKKANKTLGFLRRNLWFCNKEIKTATYEMLVRPSLEYSSVVWDPYYRNDIQKVEMTQRRVINSNSNFIFHHQNNN